MDNRSSKLITDHQKSLYIHAIKFTKDETLADDLVQDTLLKAMQFYENFKEGTNLSGWLYVIMRNLFINSYRKKNIFQSMVSQNDEISNDKFPHEHAPDLVSGSFVLADIKKAFLLIPDDQAVAFRKYFEGYKYHEIAQELNVPIGTIKTRIHKARENLKRLLRVYKN